MAREFFSYSMETGELLKIKERKGKTGWTHKAGQKGYPKDYIKVSHKGDTFRAHRLIWVIVTGEQPNFIDHIDGNGLNNKWENLRSVSRNQNARNKKVSKSNKTGTPDVSWAESRKKYVAKITDDSHNRVYLGMFDRLEDAVTARKQAEIKYNYHKNHGRRL